MREFTRIFRTRRRPRVVTVSATVPYKPLFGYVFRGLTLNASADSQAAVIGA